MSLMAADSTTLQHSRSLVRRNYHAGVIPAIVLAAGKSSRMGRPKATLPLPSGGTFLTRIVRTFLDAGVDDVVVVVGHEAQSIVDDFAQSGLPARFVVNAAYERGQLTSLAAGLRFIDRPGVVAALVTLVDVPLVSVATVQRVVERYRQSHAPIVRPTRGEAHGHPLLIGRSLFNIIQQADAETGAKPIVRAHASPAGDIDIEDEGAFFDVDTPADYDELVRVFGRAVDPQA